MKTATHPNGSTITFMEDDHRYTVDGWPPGLVGNWPLTSATTFIGQFFDKFDADKMAVKCVGKPKYADMTADEIKAQWESEGNRAAMWGNNTHAFIESLFLGTKFPPPTDDHEAALFDQAALAVLDLSERFDFLEAEKIIFCPKFGIAGLVDLVMRDPVSNHIVVLDWKTNKEFKMDNFWHHAKPPIQHLEDCHFIKYSLQLTLYEMILGHENYYPDAAGFRSGILHLTEDYHRAIKPRPLVPELTWMMF